MIFIDESGRRWQRIKRTVGVVGSTTVIPIAILAVASLLYLPSWGAIVIPTATNKPSTSVPNGNDSASSTTSNKKVSLAHTNPPTKSNSGSTASSTTAPQTNTTQLNTGQANTPAVLSTTTTPTTATPSPTPPSATAVSGNSDYGHSHQTTHP